MISFTNNEKKFNYRLGAVIISQDRARVLLHTIAGYGFYLLPGGRLEFGESSEQGIRRELKEELGLDGITTRLIATVENFFVFKGIEYHEISDDYVVYLDEAAIGLEQRERVIGLEGDQYIFDWIPLTDLDTIQLRPPLLRQVITGHHLPAQRYILDERPTP